MLSIEITDHQESLRFDADRLKKAAQAVLGDAGIVAGSLSIAVVDDPEIQALNRRFLGHDYPTDVLSFALEREGNRLEGEVVASAETAVRSAPQFGWTADDELLLYVIHGALHLVGHDDTTDELRAAMRTAERRYLSAFGLELGENPPSEATRSTDK
jgi:probable rRNA maturation factor